MFFSPPPFGLQKSISDSQRTMAQETDAKDIFLEQGFCDFQHGNELMMDRDNRIDFFSGGLCRVAIVTCSRKGENTPRINN